MPNSMTGRRVRSFADLEHAGDYTDPLRPEGAEYEIVHFLLPIARDENVPPGARSVHAVHSPPHVFRECRDGSLEIRESIAAYGFGDEPVWHGYLDEGHYWRSV